MFEDHATNVGAVDCKNKEDYRICNADLGQKLILQWSPQEENKFLFKRQYVSSSRSDPRRSKRFVRYKISRSLNFDVANSQNSSSDSSSIDGDKYLSRSAKIMRALNFSSSPTYYGKTIKRSLNFNSTPSPKRFTYKGKLARRASSLNLGALSPGSDSKPLNFDDSQSDSANNSLVFTSSDSIDENQNETPSRQGLKIREPLDYSTPTAKLSRKSLQTSSSSSPLLRSGLKERIDNIIYVSATPNPQSLKRAKSRMKCMDDIVVSTPRNLFRDFHDADDERPRTPENIVRIVPESMSAIKRSHKKERSSRWNERAGTHLPGAIAKDKSSDSMTTPQMCRKWGNETRGNDSTGEDINRDGSWKKSPAYNSGEGDISDTGSIFDYKEEKKENFPKESESKMSGYLADDNDESILKSKIVKIQQGESDEKRSISSEGEKNFPTGYEDIGVRNLNDGSKTPEPIVPSSESPRKAVTPENRINLFEHLLKDSIKKSHKKLKDENKKKLFTPNVLRFKSEPAHWENSDHYSRTRQNGQQLVQQLAQEKYSVVGEVPEKIERAGTPENVNSSRLLLSQYSSVKKSHKKDKHNKILSGFMKRQEYFNRDMDVAKDSKSRTLSSLEDASGYKSGVEDLAPAYDANAIGQVCKFEKDGYVVGTEESEQDSARLSAEETFDKSSPSKRKKSSDVPLDPNGSTSNGSYDSDFQKADVVKEEFRIFTPLKRRKSVKNNVSASKEYFCVYRLPSDEENVSEEAIADITTSRCLTPVATFREASVKIDDKDLGVFNRDEKNPDNIGNDQEDDCMVEFEAIGRSGHPEEQTGRSTPRNMSTSTLYFNIDSIKKSHKKNKRGSTFRKEPLLLDETSSNAKREEERMDFASLRTAEENSETHSSTDSIELCLQADRIAYDANELDVESSDHGCNVNRENSNEQSSTSRRKNASTNKTPPNALKTKDYIRLVQNTSIKRSHKKERDQKKYELLNDTHELSDDGSIFGDEERIACIEADEATIENCSRSGVRRK